MRDTVVVIHPGSLGDVLLAVPAIRRLRVRHPEHELVLIARPSVSKLLSECQEVDQWLSIDDQNSVELFSQCPKISGRLQAWLERCELVVAWLENKGGTLLDSLKRYGVRKDRIQSPFSPLLMQHHQSHRFLESIGEMPTSPEGNQAIQVRNEVVRQAREYLQAYGIPQEDPIVVVHPGSGSVRKCMRPEQIAAFVQRLQHDGLYPLILEGPADGEMVTHMLQVVDSKPTVLAGLELSLLAGILTQVDWYVGHDSGVTHLAAALGVQTLAIFGPTDHRRWAPLGNHVKVVQGPPCTCHSWESVGQCVTRACLDIPIETLLQNEWGSIVKVQ